MTKIFSVRQNGVLVPGSSTDSLQNAQSFAKDLYDQDPNSIVEITCLQLVEETVGKLCSFTATITVGDESYRFDSERKLNAKIKQLCKEKVSFKVRFIHYGKS